MKNHYDEEYVFKKQQADWYLDCWTLNPLYEKRMGTLRVPSLRFAHDERSEQLEKLSQLVHVLILRGTWSTNKNWAVEKENTQNFGVGRYMSWGSWDCIFWFVFVCVCVFFFSWWVFLVFGVCDLQSFHIDKVSPYTHTIHSTTASISEEHSSSFLYIPFLISPPRKFNMFPGKRKEIASSKLSTFQGIAGDSR